MKDELSRQLLSDITIYSKYARFIREENRRETWDEICDRNMNMHIKKYPHLEEKIRYAYENYVKPKKVLPSMRSCQFAGEPIEINQSRIFNCSYVPIDSIDAFSEIMFMLLGGNGVGFSVEEHNIHQLPIVRVPNKEKQIRFLVGDSLEGWADAIKVLMKSYFCEMKDEYFIYDYRDIRPKGSELIRSGGKAPGHEPLKICINKIREILERFNGQRLPSIAVHDIVCHIADAVLAGGIRRSALISFFDQYDDAMLKAKGNFKVISSYIYYNKKQNKKMIEVNYHNPGYGMQTKNMTHSDYLENQINATKELEWWNFEPQRARANNSVVLKRDEVTKQQFANIYQKTKESNSGEPGFFLTNSDDMRSNPCLSFDTPILTEKGWQPIGSLKDQELTFINKYGEKVNGIVWSSGVKDIYQIKFNSADGKYIECTDNHIFINTDGEEVEAKNLTGQRLFPFLDTFEFDVEHFKYGFIQGDSSLHNMTKDGKIKIYFNDHEAEVCSLFGYNRSFGNTFSTNEYTERLKDLEFNFVKLNERQLPKGVMNMNDIELRSFLRGLFSANGTFIESANTIKLTSSCKEELEQVKFLLAKYNIIGHITDEKREEWKNFKGITYRLRISSYSSVLDFHNLIGFQQEYKMRKIQNYLIGKAPMVRSVVKTSRKEEVFDFNLHDDSHVGVIAIRSEHGYTPILTHNCAEIALKPKQFCNLTEINGSNVENQEDFNKRAEIAAFIGTLQAGYTDLHYLRYDWKKQTEDEALIGVGITGIANEQLLSLNFSESAEIVKKVNKEIAKEIGINVAARTTTVKPSGTTSCVLGCSSGIHAWYDEYYIRRIRLGKNEAIAQYLQEKMPELVEEDRFNPENLVISIPQAAPKGSITRRETAIDTLNRVIKVQKEWVNAGHRTGENTHNVSVTINVDDNEWDKLFEALWKNRNYWTGISLLPKDNGSYVQAPFESIDEERYLELSKYLKDIDLTEVKEITDNTDLKGEIACSGGQCEII